MYSFKNDYSENAHPSILQKLMDMGLEQNNGYGMDAHCERAKQLIQAYIQCEEASIHFLPGGTITNLTTISHILKPYEAVISSNTGHINIHECGAIEATGHKVLTPPSDDGKLTPELIAPILDAHEDEFFVHPACVYISNPTEVGTIYTKSELERLYTYCKEHDLLLFLDGARLPMALGAPECQLEMKDLELERLYTYCKEHDLLLFLDGARLPMALGAPECQLEMKDFKDLTDILFIGGTKVGALFGEALVIFRKELQARFRFSMKRSGSMLAKGWLLGVQFEQLFSDGLYFELGKHADRMAMLLKKGMAEAGISFLTDSPTNQQFPILPNKLKARIEEKYSISDWSKPDEDHTCVRFCTSWATKEEDVLLFLEDLKQMIASL